MEWGSHPESDWNKNGEKQPSQSRDMMIEGDATNIWHKKVFGQIGVFETEKSLKSLSKSSTHREAEKVHSVNLA